MRFFSLIKAIEHIWQIFRRYTIPFVDNAYHSKLFIRCYLYRELAAIRRKLDRVINKIAYDLRDLGLIGLHYRMLRRKVHSYINVLCVYPGFKCKQGPYNK